MRTVVTSDVGIGLGGSDGVLEQLRFGCGDVAAVVFSAAQQHEYADKYGYGAMHNFFGR
jgi:hypothetical protein